MPCHKYPDFQFSTLNICTETEREKGAHNTARFANRHPAEQKKRRQKSVSRDRTHATTKYIYA
jgi:hypothetical protein